MRPSNILSAIALIAASAVNADEPGHGTSSDLPCLSDLCWTSWRCYYKHYSQWETIRVDRCGLPNNVYRQGYDAAPWTTLVWGESYEMKWQSSYESQDQDIVLEWLMFEAPGTEKPVQANETDMFPNYRSQGPERFVVAWSKNISRATTSWYFQPLLHDFPNAHLNVSSVQVTGYALERNVFRIYHPSTFNPHNSDSYDLSDPFMVIRPYEANMIEKAASNQKKRDNKKLAIGVGVGVGMAWVVAFAVAWFTSAWFQRRTLERKGFVLRPARLE